MKKTLLVELPIIRSDHSLNNIKASYAGDTRE